MPLQSRPTLLNLPRELHQHIIGYIFEDALEKDNRFNTLLREPRLAYRRLRAHATPDRREDQIYFNYMYSLFGRKGAKFDAAKIYAPTVSEAAMLVLSVHE